LARRRYITLKIQTDDLESIIATSADNIEMKVTSTVNWRIFDAKVAATMAAETIDANSGGGSVSGDINKIRRDVRKQALASLAAFIGSVNYSESFHMSAAAQGGRSRNVPRFISPPPGYQSAVGRGEAEAAESASATLYVDNPLYDPAKMGTAVEHANKVTRTYGVEMMSINIISASPVDVQLTKSLASGAVASAEALQAETQARGNANAIKIKAEADAMHRKIKALGDVDAELISAKGTAEALQLRAEGERQAEVVRMLGEAEGLKTLAAASEISGGAAAMGNRLATCYLQQLGEMAKHSKMMIVPQQPGGAQDVNAVLATALSIGKMVQ
jgi:regulator of protease activity HflC (stomatin/prohibitin superfamily)